MVLGMELHDAIPLGILGFIITLESIVVCYMVYRYRILRTFTNGFVVSLALSDILFGAVLLPVNINDQTSIYVGYLMSIILMANVTNMFAVTLDRYLAVMKPLIYHVKMSKFFYKILAFAWIVPIGVSLIPLAYGTNVDTLAHQIFLFGILIVGILIPYVLILAAYIMIFKEVSRQVKNLAKMCTYQNNHEALKEGKRVSGEAKMARVFAIIAGIFVLTWLPVVYMTTVQAIKRVDLAPPALVTVSWYTLCLGALTNAPIYGLMKADFRKVFQRMIKLRKSRFNCAETSSSLVPPATPAVNRNNNGGLP
ncbi:histamine H2 receptor [Nematostella vectensis]|uniref:histamine H2 receptor n=1 Tax=Nematostella vectensis TaxID=45351 RepID=UPI0013905728|nr:histamine H2 receptor [Nematostella vectensis]XP_032218559.1 histamine H2 receptor [Nematostella vectensis]XP_032218560.1 histamine H2 receptor [Nematostella vectensis]XP_032218561.1 histamine H2 receptor [Nematostella vectensis]XP_032218562.1 histamine H2 receptor [Nematostella vectensis]XP_032218563.1 histamine H2 receptor [Nematostella vectensis]XP_032218564.1 histamine H2 receptor [Nematostella vectensis]XP_048583636.1 histamine H2 receptor [Nematostella vectensis]